ncbi:MAG: ABC transporter substrate-binding protein, partial [Actinobacteria bacterium]|nr:ABC transporter substrate-binding protein [Actinomycetota bacterium]
MPVAVRDNPPDFDVHQASTVYFYLMIANPCYNSLVTWDNVDHNKIVPDLAKRWDVSPDGLSYTFYLEQGVKWHDGESFSADDVKYSLERQRFPPKGVISANMSMLEPLKTVEVLDPSTVKIQLSHPSGAFLSMMGIGGNSILPKHVLEKKGDMKRDVIGTGAWKLKKYMSGVSIELEKNREYFKKGLPYMDGITEYIIADPSSALAAFRTGRVLTDMIGHEAAAIDTIEKTMSDVATAYRIKTSLTHRNPYLNQTKPPFNDVRVRQAFNLALDRWEWEAAVEPGVYAVGGYMQPGGRWMLPDDELYSMPGYAKTGPAKDAEREKAKKLLADAGYPNGFDLEIQARNLTWSVNEAVWLSAQLSKIGIKSTIKPLETAVYFDALRGPGFQVMASG